MYRAYKERDHLKGFSLTKFAMGVAGGIFMGTWGATSGNWGIVALNLFCIMYEASILALIVRLKLKKNLKKINFYEEFRKIF